VAVLPLPPAFIPPAINAAATTAAAASAANKIVPLVVTTVGFKATLPVLLVGAAILGTVALVGELAQIWSLYNSRPEQPEEGVTTYGPLPGPVQSRTVIIEPNPLNSWVTGMGTTADTLKVRTPFVEELFGVPRFSWRGDLFRADGTTELDVCLSRATAGTCNTHADGETSIRVVLGNVSEGIEQEPDVAFQPAQPLPPPPVLADLDPQLAPLPPLPLPIPTLRRPQLATPRPIPSPSPSPSPPRSRPALAPVLRQPHRQRCQQPRSIRSQRQQCSQRHPGNPRRRMDRWCRCRCRCLQQPRRSRM
jgi:hypothetical protein